MNSLCVIYKHFFLGRYHLSCVLDEGGEVLGDHDERINGNSNGTGDSGQEEVEIPTTQPTQVN